MHLSAESIVAERRLARASGMVDRFREVTALSETVRRAMARLEDPAARAIQVAEIIETDRGLATQVLRLANSAYYAAARQFADLEEAVVRIGFGALRGLLLAAATIDPLRRPLRLYRTGPRDLWTHSMATAVAARLIADRVGYAGADEAYVAGLLHDVGMPVVDRFASREEVRAIRESVERGKYPCHEAERVVLGFDHGLVGAMLLRRWGIEAPLMTSVLEHHSPFYKRGQDRLGSITHLADVAALLAVPGPSGPGWWYPADAETVDDLRFDPSDLHGLTLDTQQIMARTRWLPRVS